MNNDNFLYAEIILKNYFRKILIFYNDPAFLRDDFSKNKNSIRYVITQLHGNIFGYKLTGVN